MTELGPTNTSPVEGDQPKIADSVTTSSVQVVGAGVPAPSATGTLVVPAVTNSTRVAQPKVEEAANIHVTGRVADPSGKAVVSASNQATGPTAAEAIQPSSMREYYTDLGFGKIDTIQGRTAGDTYAVNMHPLPYNISPCKEEPPTFADCQPITTYRMALGHENSHVYTYTMVGNNQSIAEEDLVQHLVDGPDAHAIPALAILRSSLKTNPNQGAEWPVVASQNPRHTASYLHMVQHRFSKSGFLDLRFVVNASQEYELKETYVLGRPWAPLTDIKIAWVSDHGNYDATAPDLAPAFASLETINLDDKKEITNIITTFRFVDPTPVDVSATITKVMREVSRTKASLSRLYWRIWTAILEASAAEHRGASWHVRGIRNAMVPQALNNHKTMITAIQEARCDVQPFFVTHQMLEDCAGLPVIDLMHFLTSEAFEATCQFGVTRNWPTLGKVRLYAPEENTSFRTTRNTMTIRSADLYDLLDYFVGAFGQIQLIEEIGRTVAMFCLRPEGDVGWLGHQFIKMALPPFRCVRTLYLAWPLIKKERPYDLKHMPYYKLAWLGAVRYFMISLSANVVLNEKGIFSALQLANTGVTMPPQWNEHVASLFREDRGITRFNKLIQEVGLRLDWGMLQNRMLASINFIRYRLPNFTRLAQWSEWLLFQRLQPEGSWMGAQMAHIKPRQLMRPGVSCSPTACSLQWGLNDVFYRLLTQNAADIKMHVYSRSLDISEVRPARALCGFAGLPLDGQFQHLRVGDDMVVFYEFVMRSHTDCYYLMFDWTRRTKYSWDLFAPNRYLPVAMAERGVEEIISSDYSVPSQPELTAVRTSGFSAGPPIQLPPTRSSFTEAVLVFGNPTNGKRGSRAPKSKKRPNTTAHAQKNVRWMEAGSDPDSDTESNLQRPIMPSEVMAQKYPVHYCDPKRELTAAERGMRYGMELVEQTCGVPDISVSELCRIGKKYEVTTKLTKYEPPLVHTMAYAGTAPAEQDYVSKVKRETLQRSSDSEDSSDDSEGLQDDYAAYVEELRLKKEAERVQGLAKLEAQHEAAQKEKADRAATAEILVGVNISEFKKSVQAWADANQAPMTAIELDPLWKAFDSMENVSSTATGAVSALTNRYNGILEKIDNTDILTWLRGFPPIMRGEVCRQAAAMMQACVPYLPSGELRHNIHKKAHSFFATAANNLAVCPHLTNQEMHDATGNYSINVTNWDIVGTLDEASFESWLWPTLYSIPEEESSPPVDQSQAPGGSDDVGRTADIVMTGPGIEDRLINEELRKIPEDGTQVFHVAGSSSSAPSLDLSAYSPEPPGTGAPLSARDLVGESVRWADAHSGDSSGPVPPVRPKRQRKKKREEGESENCKHWAQEFGSFGWSGGNGWRLARHDTTVLQLIRQHIHHPCPTCALRTTWPRLRSPLISEGKQRFPCCKYGVVASWEADVRSVHELPYAKFVLEDKDRLVSMGFAKNTLLVNSVGELFVYVNADLLKAARLLELEAMYEMLARVSPATLPVEARRLMVPYSLDCSHLARTGEVAPPDAYERLTTFSSYTPAPPGLREIYQVSPVFVAKWRADRVETLWTLYCSNSGMCAYEHAALFLWWSAIPEELYVKMLRTQLHRVRLAEDGGELSELLELCRQQAAAWAGDLGEAGFLWLRKYKSLYGRRKAACDLELENARYLPHYSIRKWEDNAGASTRTAYLHHFVQHARRVARRLINRVQARRTEDLGTWWSKRINYVAGGSTSNRHLVDNYKTADERLKGADRPNKKAIMELLPEDYLLRVLSSKPRMVARRSTKNEPGLKQRALYAVDDEAVMVSAYASQNIEKAMNFGGMCPLQRPADVVAWWKDGQFAKAGEVWLSADYTDFNKEHSATELYLLNLAISAAWRSEAPDSLATRQKRWATLWVAFAQKNRYVKDEQQNIHRVFSALFSGSRDTARDNTLLHLIYHNMIVEWLNQNAAGWGEVVKAYMCGDDEDVKMSDPVAAAYYYAAMKHLGWHANDSKQMCGRMHHEFLQKFPHAEKGCVGPVSSMIAALCSGQWYVKPGLQQDNAVTSISEQLWELVVRGADLRLVYLLGIDLLNDYMQVRGQGCKKKLEWWTYRFGSPAVPDEYVTATWNKGSPTAALWGIGKIKDATHLEAPPGVFFYAQSAPGLPCRGSSAWCKRWYKVFVEHGRAEKFPLYVHNIKANSYGSLFHKHIQEKKKRWLYEEWPERKSITADMYATVDQRVHEHKYYNSLFRTQTVRLLQILRNEGGRAVPETLAQKLARVGADTHMYELLGGKNNHALTAQLGLLSMKRNPPRNWIETNPHLQGVYMQLDPALRSYLTTTGPSLN